MTTSSSTSKNNNTFDHSSVFNDYLVEETDISLTRSLLHSRAGIVCRSVKNHDDAVVPATLVETAAVLAGLLHALKHSPGGGNEWLDLPVVITVPLKKQLAPVLKGLREKLALNNRELLYLEDARRGIVTGGKGNKGAGQPSVLIGTDSDARLWMKHRRKSSTGMPATWFHLLVMVPAKMSAGKQEKFRGLIEAAGTVEDGIKPGTTLLFPPSIHASTVSNLASYFRIVTVREYTPSMDHQGDHGEEAKDTSQENGITAGVLLTKEEVMLPDAYRHIDGIVRQTAEYLKEQLEGTGLEQKGSKWFAVGPVARLLADMRKQSAHYSGKQKASAGHLLRLVHMGEKIKTNPASEVLGLFRILREPGAKGKSFLELPGTDELEELLVKQSEELHPVTALVLRSCVDCFNNRERTVIISRSTAVIDSLAVLCKNAGMAVASLTGNYNPVKGGDNGYMPLSKSVCQRVAGTFYQGTAMLLFMTADKIEYIEPDGVDRVLFHDYSKTGKEVNAVIRKLEEGGLDRSIELTLFFVKNTPAEGQYWKIKRGRSTSNTGNNETKRTVKQESLANIIDNNYTSGEDHPDQRDRQALIPAGWNYRKLSRYFSRKNCLVTFTDSPFFSYSYLEKKLFIRLTGTNELLEAGFIRTFKKACRKLSDPVTGEQRWLVVERQGSDSDLLNTGRLYGLMLELRNKPVSGFKVITTGNSGETGELVLQLVKRMGNGKE